MKRYVYSMGAVMLLGCCMPALAQGYFGDPGPDYNPPKWYFAGGYTVATGEAANFVNNGWNVGTGLQWRLGPSPVSLRLDFEYSRNNATDQLLIEGAAANQIQINHGWSELWSNDLDAIYHIPLSRGINAYVMAGGGGAIRRLSLTRTVGTGGPYCNDWAGFCDAGGYPGDVLVNSKTTGRWEWNAGVGVSFSLGGGDAFFVEARYMEVETPVPRLQRRGAGDENVRFAQVVREALQRPALWESRPLDVSAVINSLAEIAKRVPALAGKIDSQRIGVGGHSMGSFTAEAVAGALVDLPGKPATSFADSRVKAILCLSPQGPGQFGLTDKSFQSLTIPYLGITGSQDNLGMLATASWHKLPFELSPQGNKYHLFIEGANHMSFISSRTLLPSHSDRGEAILRCTNSAALAFWDAYLKGDGEAKKYLRSDALTTLSKGTAKLDEN